MSENFREPGQWPSEKEMENLRAFLERRRPFMEKFFEEYQPTAEDRKRVLEMRFRLLLGLNFPRPLYAGSQEYSRWFSPQQMVDLKWHLWETLKPLQVLLFWTFH